MGLGVVGWLPAWWMIDVGGCEMDYVTAFGVFRRLRDKGCYDLAVWGESV